MAKKTSKNRVMEDVRNLLRNHEKIKAVGLYMRKEGCSLAEAKRALDAEETALGLESPVISDKEWKHFSEKTHADRYPILNIEREEPPCLMEEWSISHLSNSAVFDDCKEENFANCIVKYVKSDLVVLNVHVREPEWFRSLNEDQQKCLLISITSHLGLNCGTIVCSEDAAGNSWEFSEA